MRMPLVAASREPTGNRASSSTSWHVVGSGLSPAVLGFVLGRLSWTDRAMRSSQHLTAPAVVHTTVFVLLVHLVEH